MSRSNDPGHFFQSTSALELAEQKAAKSRNKKGSPVVLPSKILAVLADPTEGNKGSIFVAESAGTARWLDLLSSEPSNDQQEQTNNTPRKQKIYRGATAPLTSLALSTDRTTLYSGCWDKCIWAWNVSTGQQAQKFTGHSDFVKSVLCIAKHPNSSDILISGAADASIILWSAATGDKLHVIRNTERARGVLDLKIEPQLSPEAQGSIILYAGSSDPPIRRWRISVSAEETNQSRPSVQVQDHPEILAHETSVNALAFGMTADTDEDPTFDIFTASKDKTAKRLSPKQGSSTTSDGELRAFVAEATMRHPDFVYAVLVSHVDGTFATGCRDGHVRVFDSEDRGEDQEPLHTFIGHYEDVTGLALVEGVGLVSVSIDGTVRRWGGMSRAELAQVAEVEAATQAENDEVRAVLPRQNITLTEEEEAELAELMSDDE